MHINVNSNGFALLNNKQVTPQSEKVTALNLKRY